MNCLEIRGLTKNYGTTRALDNVSLRLEENKIYGLLGRNGAGKSTLLNIITGRVFADSGSVTLGGAATLENDSALSSIYLMSEKNYYPEKMKVREAFKWTAQFYRGFDMDYANHLAGLYRLETGKNVKSLSTGYGSIFKLVTAMSTNAPYILLDEPVLGLDANHRDLFYRTLIEKYSHSPSTIVLSTHLVEEISGIIEDVVIINNGRIMHNGPCEELLRQGYTASGYAAAVDAYAAGKRVIGMDILGGLKSAYILGSPEGAPAGIEISRLDLQKLFIQLTNDWGGAAQ